MATFTTTATVSTTREITLKPTIRRRLLTELKAYGALKSQLDVIEQALKNRKSRIGKLREETGEQSITLEGFKVSLVSPVRSVLDKKKLVELGCAVEWINEATTNKPTKSYEKISCPGDREQEDYQ